MAGFVFMMIACGRAPASKAPPQQEIAQKRGSARGRQIGRPPACVVLDHVGEQAVLDQTIPQDEQIAADRFCLDALGTKSPVQTDRVGQIEPASSNQALDHHDQDDHEGGAPGDRAPCPGRMRMCIMREKSGRSCARNCGRRVAPAFSGGFEGSRHSVCPGNLQEGRTNGGESWAKSAVLASAVVLGLHSSP